MRQLLKTSDRYKIVQKLKGKKIINIRSMTNIEYTNQGWPAPGIVIELTGGFQIYTASDIMGDETGVMCVLDKKNNEEYAII